jgi:hypothetical protein
VALCARCPLGPVAQPPQLPEVDTLGAPLYGLHSLVVVKPWLLLVSLGGVDLQANWL